LIFSDGSPTSPSALGGSTCLSDNTKSTSLQLSLSFIDGPEPIFTRFSVTVASSLFCRHEVLVVIRYQCGSCRDLQKSVSLVLGVHRLTSSSLTTSQFLLSGGEDRISMALMVESMDAMVGEPHSRFRWLRFGPGLLLDITSIAHC
jgi:hypothetical protein